MPKTGFRTVSVSLDLYERLCKHYEQEIGGPWSTDIKSVSSMARHFISTEGERILNQNYARLTVMNIIPFKDRLSVIIWDNTEGHVAEVNVSPKYIYCVTCEDHNCIHIGTAFTDHRIYEMYNHEGSQGK